MTQLETPTPLIEKDQGGESVAPGSHRHSNPHTPAPPAITRRLASVCVAHSMVDVYAAFLTPLLAVLEIRCELTRQQSAWLLGIGSLSSGLCQPVAAWISDRFNSRMFGALGLAIAAVCLSCIGMAHDFATLVILFTIGNIGSGIFHPIAAASTGQLADRLPGRRRSLGVSLFHLAGMIGGSTGAVLVVRITAAPNGFDHLRYMMIPGLLIAVMLFVAIRRVPHRHHHHHVRFEDGEISQRWAMVGLLYVCNALRFTVNMALVYLFVRWSLAMAARTNPALNEQALAQAGSIIAGNLNALLMVGMAIGGVSAAAVIRRGREKWPMITLPLVFAPIIALMPHAGQAGGYVLAVLAGIGFAAMIPVTISLAQRLLPHRTSLASGLMMGGAWMLAFIGPSAAEYCLTTLRLGLGETFALTAGLLAMSGLVCIGLSSQVLRRSV